jgi:hypothetical protein
LGLLAVLTVLTALLAVLGLRASPTGAELTVENGNTSTFGVPVGNIPFQMALTSSVSAGEGAGVISQRLAIDYDNPRRMVVNRTSYPVERLGVLGPAAIAFDLKSYSSVVGGSSHWVAHGSGYERTEALNTFSERVHKKPSYRGTVYESAIVRQGYLVDIKLRIVVPEQTLAGGQSVSKGVIGEVYQLERINGRPAPADKP